MSAIQSYLSTSGEAKFEVWGSLLLVLSSWQVAEKLGKPCSGGSVNRPAAVFDHRDSIMCRNATLAERPLHRVFSNLLDNGLGLSGFRCAIQSKDDLEKVKTFRSRYPGLFNPSGGID